MVRSLLIRGMLVGLLAGLLAFAFAFVFGEPQVQAAIDFEQLLAAKAGDPAEAELVSRGVQRTVGLLTGTVALGVALGGLFALVFAYAYGRIGVVGARPTAAVMALVAFATITLVPFTKYPASPPTVGDPATIDRRTLLAFAMIAITALALVAAVRVRAHVAPRLGTWNATLIAGGVFVALIAVAQLILPAVHETPPGFPADVLYRFRLASLGVNATLWLAIGLGFGAAAARLLSPAHAQGCATVLHGQDSL
ncbi:MAG: CbtA family protein [Solirubrobacterales bacterium]|nr:CbtA family protein [Solirubrobacterales bacterium]